MRRSNELEEPEGPEELARELAAAWRFAGEVPAEIDRAVLEAARRELASRRRFARGRRLWLGSAAAAALALAFFLAERRGTAPAIGVARTTFDVDGDGRVDVVDALIVARAVDARGGAKLEPAWDFDGDERVDRADVERVLAEAVRIIR